MGRCCCCGFVSGHERAPATCYGHPAAPAPVPQGQSPARRPSDTRETCALCPAVYGWEIRQCHLSKQEPQPQVLTLTCILKLKHLWCPVHKEPTSAGNQNASHHAKPVLTRLSSLLSLSLWNLSTSPGLAQHHSRISSGPLLKP